jgi:cobalamin synthase
LSLLLLALYVPWLARMFVFGALPWQWLAFAAVLGGVGVLWFELLKRLFEGAIGGSSGD